MSIKIKYPRERIAREIVECFYCQFDVPKMDYDTFRRRIDKIGELINELETEECSL